MYKTRKKTQANKAQSLLYSQYKYLKNEEMDLHL